MLTMTLKPDTTAALINATRGKIFVVEFKKADGTIRRMRCRTGVKKGVNGRGMSYDPAAHGNRVVYDIARQADGSVTGFRSFNLGRVSYFKCGATEVGIARA